MSYYDREDNLMNDYTNDNNNNSRNPNYYQQERRLEQQQQLAANRNYGSSSQQQSNQQQSNLYPPTNQPYNNHNNNNSNHYQESTDTLNDSIPLSGNRNLNNNNNYSKSYDNEGDENYANDDFITGDYSNKQYPIGKSNGGIGGNNNNNSAKTGGGAKKWIIGIIILLLIGGAGAGIAIWRIKANSNSSTSSSSGSNSTTKSSTSLQKIPGTAGAVLSDPSDPSIFQKDSRLHKSFYGLAYTAYLSQEPQCGTTLANVTEDIQIMSQLTSRIRNYGSGCNQSSILMQAIKDTKVNITVWLGVYIGSNETVNLQQMTETISVLKTFGIANIGGVTIGNEYILDATNKVTATAYIVEKVKSFKSMLAALNPPISVPVGTSDAGSEASAALSDGVDYFMANIHPFFGGLPIAQAADWTYEFFQGNDVIYTDAAPNKPQAFIAETGWPTASLTVANATIGGAVAGISESNEYLASFPCAANGNGTKYFYFETFDEGWQSIFGGVEPYWGMFTQDKILKEGIVMPSCISD